MNQIKIPKRNGKVSTSIAGKDAVVEFHFNMVKMTAMAKADIKVGDNTAMICVEEKSNELAFQRLVRMMEQLQGW